MTDASDDSQPSRFRRPMTWFIIGMVVIAVPLSIRDWMLLGPYSDVPMMMLFALGPGIFATVWPVDLPITVAYPAAALANGAVYGGLAWLVPKIPFLWVKVLVVVLPFMPLWAVFIYHELLSPDLTG